MRSSKCIVILAIAGILGLIISLDAAKPKKVKRPKPINWNSSYYSQKFGPCKKQRDFNPVELVKAQAWAVDIFQRCGPKIVIAYATSCNFPAYGIEKVTELLCYAANFGYAVFSGDGTLYLENAVRTKQFLALADAVYGAMKISKPYLTVKHRGKKLVIPVDKIYSFTRALMVCAFNDEWVSPLDGDIVKHGISHSKIMLL